MEEKNISEKESLELISQMIGRTCKNVMGGNMFILLGVLLAAFAFLSGILIMTISSMWTLYVGICLLVTWNMVAWYFVHRTICKDKQVLTYTDKAIKAVWDNTFIVGLMVILVIAIMSFLPDANSLDRLWVVPLSEIMLLFVASMISRSLLDLKFTPVVGVPGGLIPAIWLFTQEEPDAIFDTGSFLVLLAVYSCFTVVALGVSLNDKKAGATFQIDK